MVCDALLQSSSKLKSAGTEGQRQVSEVQARLAEVLATGARGQVVSQAARRTKASDQLQRCCCSFCCCTISCLGSRFGGCLIPSLTPRLALPPRLRRNPRRALAARHRAHPGPAQTPAAPGARLPAYTRGQGRGGPGAGAAHAVTGMPVAGGGGGRRVGIPSWWRQFCETRLGELGEVIVGTAVPSLGDGGLLAPAP